MPFTEPYKDTNKNEDLCYGMNFNRSFFMQHRIDVKASKTIAVIDIFEPGRFTNYGELVDQRKQWQTNFIIQNLIMVMKKEP